MAKRVLPRSPDLATDADRIVRLTAGPGRTEPARVPGVPEPGRARRRPGEEEVDPAAGVLPADPGTGHLDALRSEPAPDLPALASAGGDDTIRAGSAASEPPILLAQTSGPSGSVFDAGMPPRAPVPAAGTAAGTAAAAAGGGASLGTLLVAGVAIGAAAGGGGGGGGSSSTAGTDTTPPAAPVIGTVAGDDRVNAQERAAGITISGTAEAGSTVSVTLGATTRTATATGGAWSVDFSTAQIPGDGTVNVRATARDAAGNTSVETTRSIVIDTAPPLLQSVAVQSTPGALLLTYDEPIDGTRLPPTSAFSVTVDGVARAVSTVSASGAVVTIGVVGDIVAGAAVQFLYTDPTGGNDGLAIQDLAGNDAASLDQSGGLVSDGYLRAADVYRDANADGVADAGERVAISNASGQFFGASGGAGNWLARGGVSADTGLVNTMALAAPAVASVIHPLTTLAQAIRSLPGGPADPEQAAQRVMAGLGLLPGPRGLYGTDIVAEAGEAQRAALQLVALDALGGGPTVVTTLASEVAQAGERREALALEDSFLLARVLSGLGPEAQSVAADAATRIGGAGTLAQATAAQARALDAVAPSAPTALTGPASTSDTTPSVTVRFDASTLLGAAAVAGDRLTLLAGDEPALFVLVSGRVLTAGEIAAGQAVVDLPTLGQGVYTLHARITDGVGRESGLSSPLSLRVDTQAPLSPTVLPVAGNDIIGIAESSTAILSGGAEPGAAIAIAFSGVTRTTTANDFGAWSYALTAADLAIMGQGTESVSVTATDGADNVSAATAREFAIDTVAPSAQVTITRVEDDIGVLIANGQTSVDNTLVLRGTVAGTLGTGEQVHVFEGDTLLGVVSAPGGIWSYSTPGLANDRVNVLTARIVDAAGNTGPASAEYRVNVVAFVPFSQATIDTPAGVTDEATPDILGSVSISLSAGEVVRLYDGGAPLPGVATFADFANWSYTLPGFGDGTRRLRAVVEDSIGNQSTASAEVLLTVDTTPPEAPRIDVIAFDDRINAQERTAGVLVRGSAEPDSEVTLQIGALSARIVTAASGQWSVVLSEGEIPQGTLSAVVTAVARDAADNVSPIASRTVQVDTVAPTVAFSPVGGDDSLSTADLAAGADFTATVAGAAGVLLHLETSGGIDVVRALTFAGGNTWQYALVEADLVAIGQGIITARVRAFDAFGNIGAEQARAVTVDSEAPVLTPFSLVGSSDSGVLGDGRSSALRPAVSFVAEAGATVRFDPGTGTFGAPVAASGVAQTLQGSADLPGDGRYTLRVQAVDAAGNASERIATYILDRVGPTIVHAQRTGDTIVLTADEGLAPGALAPADFGVEVAGGPSGAPASAQAAGRSLTAVLSTTPGSGDTVALTYTAPGSLADASGNPAGGFRAIVGTAAADTLAGGTASELLAGGGGADTLSGGGGDDTFSFALAQGTAIDQGSGAPGSVQWDVGALARLLDANAGDRVRLDALGDVPGGLALAPAATTTVADGSVIAVRGDYDALAGRFTQSSTGAGMLIAWDSAASVGTVSPAGLVLEGVTTVSAGPVPGLLLVG